MVSGWCEIDRESHRVGIKEPWSDELEPAKFDTFEKLLCAARIWGTVAGGAHASASPEQRGMPSARLTLKLPEQMLDRSGRYRDQLDRDFRQFVTETRVKECRSAAEGAVRAIMEAENPRGLPER